MCLLILLFNTVKGKGLFSLLPFQAQEMIEALFWDKRRGNPGANLREWPILVSLSENAAKRKSLLHTFGPKLNLNAWAEFLQSSVEFYWSSVEGRGERGERWRNLSSWWRGSNKTVLFWEMNWKELHTVLLPSHIHIHKICGCKSGHWTENKM